MQPRHKASRLVVVNGSQPNQKQPKTLKNQQPPKRIYPMKNLTTILLFCVLVLSTTLLQAGNGNGKSSTNTANTTSTASKLTAESSIVKTLYTDIEQNLRLPAKLLQLFEGEKIEVLFTIDSAGQVTVLETHSASPLLEKQLERSFKNLRVQSHELLLGERFSLQLLLKP